MIAIPWQQMYFAMCARRAIAGHQAFVGRPWRKSGKSELIGRLKDKAMRAQMTVELLLKEN